MALCFRSTGTGCLALGHSLPHPPGCGNAAPSPRPSLARLFPRSLPSQVTPVRVHYSLSWQAHPVPHNLEPIKAREAPVVMEASSQSGSP